MSSTTQTCLVIASPIGPLRLASDGAALTEVWMQGEWSPRAGVAQIAGSVETHDALLAEAARQLRAYFDGRLHDFDLPLAPRGTDFQLRVWRLLRAIPYGATASYGEIAKRLGDAGAARAVGLANGANPIPIIVPCHRVIGADGSMTGFGGGIARKRWLLAHEARCISPQGDLFGAACA
ncbi:MAG: methylated-DNA--protein-cysteine methyltransferase [Betaproteobacteria bacterium]